MIQRTIKRDWLFDNIAASDPTFSRTVVGEATVARVPDGWRLRLTDADEAQSARVDMGGELLFDVDKLRLVTFTISGTAIPAGVEAYFGLAIANQAAINDIATRVLFGSSGSNALSLRVDDGVVDSGAVPTQFEIPIGRKAEFTIDFANGLESAIPAYLSRTGKDALQFYGTVGGSLTMLQRAGLGLTHYSSGLQPYVRIGKASGTAAADLFLHRLEIEYQS
jgi:hypothetical protein